MTHASQLEFALLGLIKQNAQSGYDLRKTFATTPMRHFSDSPGSIYPALRRLQSRKWISSAAEKGNGRKRQVFSITKAGDRAFVDWLSNPITREDVIWGLDQTILRFAFLDGNVERAVTLAFLEQLEHEVDEYVRELKRYATDFGPGIKFTTGALAFECGIQGYEAQLAWARQARKTIKENSR